MRRKVDCQSTVPLILPLSDIDIMMDIQSSFLLRQR